MKVKRLLALIGSVCLVLALAVVPFMAACAPEEAPPEEETYKLIFSEDYAEDSTYGDVTKRIVENIEKETNGRVEVEVHYAASLFSRPAAIEAVQNGTIQMTITSPCNDLQPYEPSWMMFSCPLLILNNERLMKFWQSPAGEELRARTAAQGITCMVPYGTMDGCVFNATRPLEKVEDFYGLKIRCPTSPVTVAWVEAIGAQGVAIPMAEAPTAIQTGMVDGYLYVMFAAVPIWEAQYTAPYYCSTAFESPFGMVIVNRDWLESLPDDIRAGVIKGVEDARQYHIDTVAKDHEAALEVYRETPGTVITEFDKEELAKAMEIFYLIYEEYADETDGWYILNTFLEME